MHASRILNLFSRTIGVLSLAFVSVLAQPDAANAIGVDSSGGGNAIVCRGPAVPPELKGPIVSAKVLDLYEAEVVDGLNLPTRSGAPDDFALLLLKKLEDLNPEQFRNAANPYKSLTDLFTTTKANLRILPSGVGLTPIPNSLSPINPKGCGIEQLAAYQATGKLLVDGEIWDKLDDLSRAGLYVHEVVYKWLRISGATNSLRARKIVGALFSDFPLAPVEPAEVPERLFCHDEASPFFRPQVSFWVAPYSADPAYSAAGVVSFIVIDGEPVVSARNITLRNARLTDAPVPPTYSWDAGNTQSTFEGSEIINLQFRSEVSNTTVNSYFEMQVVNAFGITGRRLDYKIVCFRR